MENPKWRILTPEEREQKRQIITGKLLKGVHEDPILANVYETHKSALLDLAEVIAPTPLVIVELEGVEVWCSSSQNPTEEEILSVMPNVLAHIAWYNEKPISQKTDEELSADPLPSFKPFTTLAWRRTT
jgi:hypothetical protein